MMISTPLYRTGVRQRTSACDRPEGFGYQICHTIKASALEGAFGATYLWTYARDKTEKLGTPALQPEILHSTWEGVLLTQKKAPPGPIRPPRDIYHDMR